MTRTLAIAALALGTALAAGPAAADSSRGPCYSEGDHVRCFGYPFREDRAVDDPVTPPRPTIPESRTDSLDRTGKPRFDANESLWGNQDGPESMAEGRRDRYRPLPDQDGGYHYPGTRPYPGHPTFGKYRNGVFD